LKWVVGSFSGEDIADFEIHAKMGSEKGADSDDSSERK